MSSQSVTGSIVEAPAAVGLGEPFSVTVDLQGDPNDNFEIFMETDVDQVADLSDRTLAGSSIRVDTDSQGNASHTFNNLSVGSPAEELRLKRGQPDGSSVVIDEVAFSTRNPNNTISQDTLNTIWTYDATGDAMIGPDEWFDLINDFRDGNVSLAVGGYGTAYYVNSIELAESPQDETGIPNFAVTDITVFGFDSPGDRVTIEVTFINEGNGFGEEQIPISINGVEAYTATVALDPGQTAEAQFEHTVSGDAVLVEVLDSAVEETVESGDDGNDGNGGNGDSGQNNKVVLYGAGALAGAYVLSRVLAGGN